MTTPMFQRRHYEAIADAIRNAQIEDTARDRVIISLGFMFENDNPYFNYERFSKRCKNE